MVKEQTYRLVTFGAIIGGGVLFVILLFLNGGFGPSSESAARAALTHFGTEMQKVSLLSPDASSTLASTYGDLVASELLAKWQRDPEHAPGRLTSSPYPARIEILSSARQGTGYVFTARVIMETSSGEAGSVPVVVYLTPRGNQWIVTSYDEQVSGESAPSSEE